jgi:hypothetical protein
LSGPVWFKLAETDPWKFEDESQGEFDSDGFFDDKLLAESYRKP